MDNSELRSAVDQIRALPQAERAAALRQLDPALAAQILFDSDFWLRPNQQLPPGDWRTCVMLSGRGWGKTRAGAEAVRRWIRDGYNYVNLVGATASDSRDTLVEGESGILACCPPSERPVYVASKSRLEWPNGTISLIFSAEEPDRARGKQHSKLWCDELCAWRWPQDAFDQLLFGLRLGDNPQTLITSTPRPIPLLKRILAEPTTITVRGTSYENAPNLAPGFLQQIIRKYEGTRLGRQELQGELLEDVAGALFRLEDIETARVAEVPELARIVIAIDPAVTANQETSDETGIIVAGVDRRNPAHFFVLDDLSTIASPDSWARRAVLAYHHHHADRIIGEQNNGGDLIQTVIRHVDANVSYRAVHASRGKVTRAEPVAALYEQHRVHHAGAFATLEDQMCSFVPGSSSSPDRMDSLVWCLTELSQGGDYDMQGIYQILAGNAISVEESAASFQKDKVHYGLSPQPEKKPEPKKIVYV